MAAASDGLRANLVYFTSRTVEYFIIYFLDQSPMAPAQQTEFTTNCRTHPAEPLIDNIKYDRIVVPDSRSWKNLLAYMGPNFLVCIAKIDPRSFRTNLQAGAQYKYELLRIILLASCAALIIQSPAANLGVVTGKHLAELCRDEYPRVPNSLLWILAEIAIVPCDTPEGIKFIQDHECFFAELGYAKPISSEVLHGLFVPQLEGNGATKMAISLLGAMFMLVLYDHICIIWQIAATTWIIGSLIMGINIYYLAGKLVTSLHHSNMNVVGIRFCGLLGVSAMLFYLANIAYLVIQKNKEGYHIIALTGRPMLAYVEKVLQVDVVMIFDLKLPPSFTKRNE